MSRPLAYWDSSALVPLCVPQTQSLRAAAIYRDHQAVTWWATEVEIISGLTRLERMGQITRAQFLQAKRLAQDVIDEWISAHSPASVVAEARRLLELYPLRAADSLQLAVALEACDHRAKGFLFVTADQRLAEAARLSGFAVELI